jgi:hypothetical protein
MTVINIIKFAAISTLSILTDENAGTIYIIASMNATIIEDNALLGYS